MTTKQKILGAALIGFVIFTCVQAFAEEDAPKLKSVTTAWVLGLDPIPGDALFYAGKPVQGVFNVLIGVAGAVPFYLGAVIWAQGDSPGCSHDGGCLSSAWGKLFMTIGAAAYVPALI